MEDRSVRILIVDDSMTYRSIVRRAVEGLAGVEVVGSAGSGQRALDILKREPADLVTLDVEMPGMDGMETLKRIKQASPETNVVMVSGVEEEAARVTIQALEAGALDFIPKPAATSMEVASQELSRELSSKIDACRARCGHAPAAPMAPPAPAASRPSGRPAAPRATTLLHQVDLVVVGVSTGGPNCLAQIIPRLSGDLQVPVLLVQHMPPPFTRSMANHLDGKSPIRVEEAEAGQVIRPGRVLIAPGGRHMEVRPENGELRVKLTDDPPVNSCRPAVDVLFRSVARYCSDKRVLVVVLTGMGADGAGGTRLITASCKSRVIIQDEASSVVWGMPGAVAAAGLADEVLDQAQIGERINTLARGLG